VDRRVDGKDVENQGKRPVATNEQLQIKNVKIIRENREENSDRKRTHAARVERVYRCRKRTYFFGPEQNRKLWEPA